MPNTQFENLRELAIKRKIIVITARQPRRPGETHFKRPTGHETLCIDYINLL